MYHVQDMLLENGTDSPILVGSPAWFSWLTNTTPSSFALRMGTQACTLRSEQRGENFFWYAYHKQQGKLRKVYVGVSAALTQEHLTAVLAKVTGNAQPVKPVENVSPTAPDPQEPPVRLFLFGNPGLYVADTSISLSAKTFALLAYLALTEIPPTREYLVTLLWPESAQEAARKNLQNMLWHLRSLLADSSEIVQVLPNGRVALVERVWIDARVFLLTTQKESEWSEQLSTALLLYRGPLLDGLSFGESAALEHWVLNERERFSQLCLRLLNLRIETLRSTGAWTEMLELAQRALAIDPLQEPFHRFAMLAYARLGQRTEALRQYEQMRTLLHSELGIAPLPETESLRTAIVQGHIAALPGAHIHSPSLQEASASHLPFVGRTQERQTLDRVLQQVVQQQQAQVVMLAGELGIGKSRLWREWSSLLPSNYTVVECRCLESTQSIPFAPFTRLVSATFARPHAPRLDTIWLSELARLVPELRVQHPALPLPVSLPAEQERGRLFDACLHALQALGNSPFVLFVDDAHWADEATLDWLAYCLEGMKHTPLLLLIAYRPQDARDGLKRVLAAWERAAVVEQIALVPLSKEEIASVLSPAQKASVKALHAQSAGNPYYLSELLQAEGEQVPLSLKTLIQTRLDTLPAVARQIVQAAAILDPDIEMDLLRQTSGRSEDETLDALDVLVQTNFLKEGDAFLASDEEFFEQSLAYLFTHPFVSTLLRENLGNARRIALHKRAAEALVARYAQYLPPSAGRLFEHYYQSGQRQQAAHYAEMAGEYALTAASSTEARAFFQKSLALEASGARYIGLAQAYMRSGAIEDARAALLQALKLFAGQEDSQGTFEAITYYFETFTLVGQYKEAIEWIERPKIQQYSRMIDADTMMQIQSLLMAMKYRFVTPSLLLAEEECINLLRLLKKRPNPTIELRAYLTLATTLAEEGKWHEAVAAYHDYAEAAHAAGDIFQEVLARNNVAYHNILLRKLERARKEIEGVLALVKTYALSSTQFYVYNTYGELFLAQGEWLEAERWFKRALALVKQRNDTQEQVAELYANLGRAAKGRNDLTTATKRLERANAIITQSGVPFQQTQIALWLADVYSISSQRDAALALLKQKEQLLQESGWQELQRRAAKIAQRLS